MDGLGLTETMSSLRRLHLEICDRRPPSALADKSKRGGELTRLPDWLEHNDTRSCCEAEAATSEASVDEDDLRRVEGQ